MDNCSFTESNLNSSGIYSVKNEHEKKKISEDFKCDHNPGYPSTICYFVVGVVGKENHGTHFEVVLTEKEEHKLVTPGHLVKVSMSP